MSTAESNTQQITTYPRNLLKERFYVEGTLLMYMGSLGHDQGTDLLLESFAMAQLSAATTHLVIVGGTEDDIHHYQQKANLCGIGDVVHFIEPQPEARAEQYLIQADVLILPCLQDTHSPIPLSAWLNSGTAMLATDLPAHTQLLNPQIALLAQPQPAAFAEAMLHLISDAHLRQSLGSAARTYVAQSPAQPKTQP